VVFVHGRLRKEEDEGLPSTMTKIPQEAQKDLDVPSKPNTSVFAE